MRIHAQSLVRGNQSGRLFTYATWTEGVPTYLPDADEIAFVRVDDASEGTPLGRAAMPRVHEVLGRLLEPVDCYPPRWRTLGAPTPEELAGLDVTVI